MGITNDSVRVINLGLGCSLEVVNTDFAKSFHLDNSDSKRRQELGIILK